MTEKFTYAGPALHKIERYNPTQVIARLERENPRRSRDEIERLFIAEIEDDVDYRTPALKYYFWHAWNGLHPEKRPPPASNPKQRANMQAQAKTFLETMKRNVIISELLMQNGKKVADCTGTEMAKFGGFYAKIGQIVKGRKVGAVLTEEQLRKLWQESR